MELTKEQLLAMLGTLEGFSAEDIRAQVELRQVNVTAALEKFRRFHEITTGIKK